MVYSRWYTSNLHPMNKQKIDKFNGNNNKIEIDIIPSKARHSNEHLNGFDDDLESFGATPIKPGLHIRMVQILIVHTFK